MTWLYVAIWIPLVVCFGVGMLVSSLWWVWRRRSIDAQAEVRRLAAEVESDRLRLRVSGLKSAESRAEQLAAELAEAEVKAARMSDLQRQIKELRVQLGVVTTLEREVITLRARADDADRLEQHVAELEARLISGRDHEPGCDLNLVPVEHADDLKVIKGIGPALEVKLQELGIRTWEQLAALTEEQVQRVGASIGMSANRIARDRWVEQAAELIRSHPLSDPYDRPTKGRGR